MALSLLLDSAGALSVTFLVGIMLFVFDLFGPIKALYTQATRLTVMNSCMDRIEEVFARAGAAGRWPGILHPGDRRSPGGGVPECRALPTGRKDVLHDISFTLPAAHQMLALVGPSGGGKSTSGQPARPVLGCRIRDRCWCGARTCGTCVLPT